MFLQFNRNEKYIDHNNVSPIDKKQNYAVISYYFK